MNNKVNGYNNLFLTDGHDMEMMIINENFEEVINREFLDDSNLHIIENVELDIRHISYIKWYNQKENKRLCVDRLCPYNGFYDGNTTISIADSLKKVNEAKENAEKDDIEEHDIIEFEETYHTVCYKDLTNGHDMLEGLCRKLYFINKDKKGKKPDPNELIRLARTAFNSMEFCKTRIYQDIMKWQENNSVCILC